MEAEEKAAKYAYHATGHLQNLWHPVEPNCFPAYMSCPWLQNLHQVTEGDFHHYDGLVPSESWISEPNIK